MISRLFKTILVINICIGISLPTNAAVSVSDGSAFVTKAEFSADLNNLSNRMAQLENSLDAKIDSLVSSYLTRNGIWNGANQELKNYYLADCLTSKSLSAKTIDHGYKGFQGKTQSYSMTINSKLNYPSAMNTDFDLHQVLRQELDIVENINKTGMLYMTFNVAPIPTVFDTTSDLRTYITFLGDSTARLTHAQWVFEFFANGVPFSRCDITYQNTFDRDPSGSKYLCYTAPFNQFKILSFVSKGDNITLKDYWEFKRNTGSGGLTSSDFADYAGVLCTVDDCAVY